MGRMRDLTKLGPPSLLTQRQRAQVTGRFRILPKAGEGTRDLSPLPGTVPDQEQSGQVLAAFCSRNGIAGGLTLRRAQFRTMSLAVNKIPFSAAEKGYSPPD